MTLTLDPVLFSCHMAWPYLVYLTPDHVLFTCPSLYELGPLVGAAEGGHVDLVEASGGEGGEEASAHAALQGDGREHLHVVEEELDLVVVHIAWGGQPGHTQVLRPPAG